MGRRATFVLERVEAPLHHIAGIIHLNVERPWLPTPVTTGFPMLGLVIFDGDCGLDTATPQALPDRPGGIGLIRQHPVWPGPWPTPTRLVDPDPIEYLR